MTLKIIHKNNTSAGQAPAPSDLDIGEIAVNSADAELYTKDTDGNIRKFQNTTVTGTADGVNFTQAGSGATQRTVESKLRDIVNVKDFGAVGDGVTDDRAAIKTAVEHLNNVGGVLYFPDGTYYSPYLDHSDDSNWIEITKSNVSIVGEGNATLQNILFYIHGSYGSEISVGASGFTSGDFEINTATAHGLAVDDYVQLLSGINAYSTDAGDWQLGSRNPTTNLLTEVRLGEIHQVAQVNSSTTASLYSSIIYADYKDNTSGQSEPMSGVTGATIRKLTPVKNVALKNLTFKVGSNAFRNIVVRYAANIHFENCSFETTGGEDGVHVKTYDSINLIFTKCNSIREPVGASGSAWNSFVIGGGCQNVRFDNCYFVKGSQHIDFTNGRGDNDVGFDNGKRITTQIMSVCNSFFVNCSDGFTTHPGTFDLTAVGNTFESCRTAIRVRNRRSVITGNNCRATRAGFSLSAFYEDTLISQNNITQSLNSSDEQWKGIQLSTLVSDTMNNNDFQNVTITGNIIRRLGTNSASDGILLDRSTASDPGFTLDTDAEKAKMSNVVVCDNRLFNCSIRVEAYTNGVNILRNMFEGTSNRSYFIQCEENSARNKVAENYFNSTATDAVLVSNCPSSVFSGTTTTHRVGARLGQLPTVSSLNNISLFRRNTDRSEINDDILFGNGSGIIATRGSGDAQLRLDALPEDGTSNAEVRVFAEGSTATTGNKLFRVYGDAQVDGALSKGSGSFKIKHPLPALQNTHNLVHSFVEAPSADLVYSGMVTLVDGFASVNIDEAANMTSGTFEALCRSIRRFCSNETGWSAVKSQLNGSVLNIFCEDETSTDTVFWMVIGERQDEHMYKTGWTDDEGHVVVEPLITEI